MCNRLLKKQFPIEINNVNKNKIRIQNFNKQVLSTTYQHHIMGIIKPATPPPPLFQSKLLCLSVFYLASSILLALYNSLSPTQCLFRSSPFDPVQSPLFLYPSSYGEHKYAISSSRPSCNSPVFFAGNSSHYVVVFLLSIRLLMRLYG